MRYSSAAFTLLLPVILASSVPSVTHHDFTPRLLSVDVAIGTCIKLNADVDLSAQVLGLGADAKAKVGACVCVDVEASLNLLTGNSLIGANADVDVYVQLQAGAAARVASGQSGKALKAFLDARAGLGAVCNISPSLFPNSQHDFAAGCCARKCNPGYFLGKNIFNQPICTQCPADKPISFTKSDGNTICVAPCKTNEVRQNSDGRCICTSPFVSTNGVCGYPSCPPTQTRINGECGCKVATEIKCGEQCYDKNAYTCPSGIATPKNRKRSRYECMGGKTYCPTVGSSGWECVDTMNDIESCGGCADPSNPFGFGSAGADCTAIAGIDSVSCRRGECRIHSCQDTFVLTSDGKSCVPALAVIEAKVGSNRTQQKLIIMRES